MGVDIIVVPQLPPSTGIGQELNSYAQEQQTGPAQAQTSLMCTWEPQSAYITQNIDLLV
jgi:hypothetical protein